MATFLVVAFGIPRKADADMYQCESPDGSIHFTNIRPQGGRCKVIHREEKSRVARSTGPIARTAVSPLGPDPERHARYHPLIIEAARLYQLPVAFLRAIMKVESDFNPSVVSPAGAMGLMQLMPTTARAMGVQNPFDPRENVLGGARYLRVLANKFNGDLILTIAAYNAGEGAVVRYGGVPPYMETRRYVQNVLRHYYSFRQSEIVLAER